MARSLTAIVLAGLLLVPFPVQSAPADLKILNEASFLLRTRHWNPSLDIRAIVRAGVPGLNRMLARASVPQRIEAIPEGASEAATIAAFGQRLDKAVRLAGGRLTQRELLYGAMRSMFASVGRWPHNGFLAAACKKLVVSSRESRVCLDQIAGISVYLFRSADRWVFSQVYPSGPAAKAGIREGDVILRIDGVAVSELAFDEVGAVIAGAPGTQVRLTLRRGTEELQVSVTRGDRVNAPVVEGRMLGDGVAYLRVYQFPGVARVHARSRLAELLQARPKGLVLDLRSNYGGGDRDASGLLGLFLPKGTRTFKAISRSRQYFIVTTDVPIAPSLPLIVLINRYTLSNGEAVAAAFQETGRARLVGERTYGAVEVGIPTPLSDGSRVVIAMQRGLTAKGREIEGRGVSPDVEFPHDLAADRDLLLERAVQLLLQRLR